ncbi:hypothetical protein BDN72DRAFT_853154 [Pluteus cervinus]|uniref:Uncharacterized protein n=1 Tax=Pluteus cervinus TaxID=181527 RepID=A0ACD3BEK6_9AGAR|nr:hypothetical protein BDN72DRAFT_853154 [Pluteus cervinus]
MKIKGKRIQAEPAEKVKRNKGCNEEEPSQQQDTDSGVPVPGVLEGYADVIIRGIRIRIGALSGPLCSYKDKGGIWLCNDRASTGLGFHGTKRFTIPWLIRLNKNDRNRNDLPPNGNLEQPTSSKYNALAPPPVKLSTFEYTSADARSYFGA